MAGRCTLIVHSSGVMYIIGCDSAAFSSYSLQIKLHIIPKIIMSYSVASCEIAVCVEAFTPATLSPKSQKHLKRTATIKEKTKHRSQLKAAIFKSSLACDDGLKLTCRHSCSKLQCLLQNVPEKLQALSSYLRELNNECRASLMRKLCVETSCHKNKVNVCLYCYRWPVSIFIFSEQI